MSDRPTVAFVVRYVNHYREPFYLGLRDALRTRGIDFELIHGAPSRSESIKRDSVEPPWATFVENRVLEIGDREFVHQPVLSLVSSKDLVIVEQASRLLLNYRLLARRRLRRRPAIALIGHGANRASSPSRLGEFAKRLLTNRIDWFFAYTDGTKHLLEANGFAPDRITVFNNTLDLAELRSNIDAVTDEEVERFRSEHEIGEAGLVLTIGSLYPDKRPELAIEVGRSLIAQGRDVHTMLIGSGSLEGQIKREASAESWLHHMDAAFGHDKAVALRAADVLLIPGVAGLVVLDGFAAGLPIVTAANEHHPPEIDYVEHGKNGLIVGSPSARALGEGVASLLDDADFRAGLGARAAETGASLTIDAMIDRFAEGVAEALGIDAQPTQQSGTPSA